MKMKDKIILIIIILGAVIAFQKGCFNVSSEAKGPDTLVVHDTTWQEHTKIIVKDVPVIHEIPVDHKVLVKEYQPDTSYPKLKAQYEALVKSYASKRVYRDSVKVGTYGHIEITDTVSENKLSKRTAKDNFKIPIVKETMTITKYAEPKRQLYIGGGINLNSGPSVRSAEGGLLYKTKRDQIYGAKINVGVDGSITYGVNMYYKINLKK